MILRAYIITISLMIWLMLPSRLSAQTFILTQDDSEPTIIANNEIINEDVFFIGEKLVLDGRINGDLYAFASSISLNGNINGNVFLLGKEVYVRGELARATLLIGQNILVSGSAAENLNLVGINVYISPQTVINDSLNCLAIICQNYASVTQHLNILAHRSIIGGHIEGNLNISGNRESISNEASIAGEVNFIRLFPENISGSKNNTISTPSHIARLISKYNRQSTPPLSILMFSGLVLIGLVYIKCAPNQSLRSITLLEDDLVKSFMFGSLLAVSLPIVSIILIVTVIGSALGSIILGLTVVLMYVSKITVMYWLGARLLNRIGRLASRNMTFLIGSTLYLGMISIRPISLWVIIIALVLGMGSTTLSIINTYQSARKLKLL